MGLQWTKSFNAETNAFGSLIGNSYLVIIIDLSFSVRNSIWGSYFFDSKWHPASYYPSFSSLSCEPNLLPLSHFPWRDLYDSLRSGTLNAYYFLIYQLSLRCRKILFIFDNPVLGILLWDRVFHGERQPKNFVFSSLYYLILIF